jgi:hypothetical protein
MEDSGRGTSADEAAPTAADALAIIQRTQSETASRLTPNVGVIYGVWGLAWLAIGLVWFLARVGGLTETAAGWTTGGVVVVGLVVSTVVGVRGGRGVRGRSSTQGLWYGLAWPISMVLLGVIVGAIGAMGVSNDVMAVLGPALFVFLAGALYLVSGAIWTSLTDYLLGAWIMAVAAASVIVGLPASPLVIGIGGGGALLLVGLRAVLRGRPV